MKSIDHRATEVSIIIPVYNALEFARACLESVYRAKTSVPFEVIVVNNGSSSDVAAWLNCEIRRRPNLVAVHFDQALGFARAVNEGARRAKHEALVLLNSDTLVTDGWLDGLQDALLSDSQLGVVSPVTNFAGNALQVDPQAESIYPEQAGDYAASISGHKEVVYEAARLVFFCVMIRRALWELLAGLEESYGVGNGEDNDFCLRARLARFRLAVAKNVFVFHHGHTTFRANDLDHIEWIARNQLHYCSRASRWARSVEFPGGHWKQCLPELSVVIPAKDAEPIALGDSLASLANQTVRDFETIVISPYGAEFADVFRAFEGQLNTSRIEIDRVTFAQPAAAFNAGLAAAKGRMIAYLPAGDIYYPFHLEHLADWLQRSRADAVYSAWSVVNRTIESTSGDESREAAATYNPTGPLLGLDNYSPLPCWMHVRAMDELFDDSFGYLFDWEFILRLTRRARTCYVPRVSYERRLHSATMGPSRFVLDEAERLLQVFPATQTWQAENRSQFLMSVEMGKWNEFPLLTRLGKPPEELGVSQITADRSGSNGSQRSTTLQAVLDSPTAQHDADARRLRIARDALARATTQTRSHPRPAGPADILLFSVIQWNHLTQRPQHFARQLALRGHRVFWIDIRLKPLEFAYRASLPRQLEAGLFYVELPATVPLLYQLNWTEDVLETMEMAVAHIRTAFAIDDAIQLVSRPKWGPLAYRLRERFDWPIVYDCVDDTKAFAAMNHHDGGDFEDEMAKRCDLLVACSRLLYEDRRRHNSNTIQILNAGDYELFHRATPSGLLAHLSRPIAGYFGALSGWLDLDWIIEVAERFPQWSFVYIGRRGSMNPASLKRWETLTSIPNIHIFGQVDPPKLAAYLAEFDICTMPFLDLPMTRIMNAVKIYEYLAAGKPVVIPDVPELRPLADRGLIAVYGDYEHSFQLLEHTVQKPSSPEQIAARKSFAAQNTWDKRVDELLEAFSTLRSRAARNHRGSNGNKAATVAAK